MNTTAQLTRRSGTVAKQVRQSNTTIARLTAAALVLCGVVHLAGAIEHWQRTPALAAATVVAAAACSHCIPALWQGPRQVTWVWATLGSGAMLSLHLAIMIQMQGAETTVEHHREVAAMTDHVPNLTDSIMLAGLVLPVVCLALVWRATSPSTLTPQT